MSELAFYLCAGFFAVLTPLCCVVHAKSPEAMRIRQVGNISIFGGWLVIFLGGVFADMGSAHDYGKLFFGLLGFPLALGYLLFWYLAFWLFHKITGGRWPTRFADEPIVTRKGRWYR